MRPFKAGERLGKLRSERSNTFSRIVENILTTVHEFQLNKFILNIGGGFNVRK
jgi:hypothetical protein